MSSTLFPFTFSGLQNLSLPRDCDDLLTARTVVLASNVLGDSIVEIDAATGMITPLIDPRSGGMRKPFGLDIGPDGALYAVSGGTRQ